MLSIPAGPVLRYLRVHLTLNVPGLLQIHSSNHTHSPPRGYNPAQTRSLVRGAGWTHRPSIRKIYNEWPRSATANMQSAREHPGEVTKYTQEELSRGHLVDPLMAKVDFESAYHLIPVYPQDHLL